MKIEKEKLRLIIIGVLIFMVLGAYVVQLLNIQVVDGEKYLALLTAGSSRIQTVKAARGEIVDRYGNPFTYNEIGFDVIFDRALMPSGINNNDISKIIGALNKFSEKWVDNLPISQTQPFEFNGTDKALKSLRSLLKITDYATCDDAMHWLIEKYKLEEFSPEEARIIAGVRYEMEVRNFSIATRYTLASGIKLETAVYLKQFSSEIPGMDIEESPVRSYEDPSLAPHIVGRTGPIPVDELANYVAKGYALNDTVGIEGIERAFEEKLRGKDGTRRVYLNSNHEVFDTVDEVAAIPGNTVTLTIDKKIQNVGIEALVKEIKYLNETAPTGKGKEADAGAFAVIDVKTGEVLALASYPSYDITTYTKDYNELRQNPLQPLFNRAISGQYTPGSIFKPVVAIAGLNEGVITKDTRVNCQRVYNYVLGYSPTCLSYHGPVTVKDALRQSCNIFFYDTGRQLGIARMNKYAKELGLGVATGIELKESLGTQSDPNTKNPGDHLQAAIGQMGNSYTPLQLANYTATLARRGERLKLTLVNSINSYNFDESVYAHTPIVALKMDVPREHFETVIDGMVQASHIGTAAQTFGSYPIKVASKTGTPQTLDLPNSTFIAFAPADDPQIAIAVIIEKGWHGYTGAPVAKAIFDAVLFPNKSTESLVPSDALLP